MQRRSLEDFNVDDPLMKKIICHDINKKRYEIDSSQLIYRPSVYGVLIEKGKVLLSKQYDGYDFPGGGAELGETIHEVLEREFFEETGFRVEVNDPIHFETSFFHPSHSKKHKDEFWNCPLLYLAVTKTGGELSTENFDEEEKEYASMVEWIDLSEIENIKFLNSVDSVAIIRKHRNFAKT